MDKEEVIKLATEYLDDFKIPYHWITTTADTSNSELFFLTMGMANSPGHYIETTIDFNENYISARSYYNENGRRLVATHPERFPPLFRLLNYINEQINSLTLRTYSSSDEEEPQEAIFTPVITLDEEYNIKYSLIVEYKRFEDYSVETLQMIFRLIPCYLDAFALPIFGIITGKMSLKEAMEKAVKIGKRGVFLYDAPPDKEEEYDS